MLRRTLSILFMISIGSSSVTAGFEGCPSQILDHGPSLKFPAAKLGSAIDYWNEGEDRPCYLLSVRDTPVGRIWAHLVAAERLYVFRCIKHDSSNESPSGPLYGSFDKTPYAVETSPAGVPQLTAVSLPGYSIVANPSYCGSHVAYWQTEPQGVHAVIVDLKTGRLVAERAVEAKAPRTDFSGHSPKPTWRSAEAVEFHPTYRPDPSFLLRLGEPAQ